MAGNQKVKEDFDASLQRLGEINNAIAANIENKKQFSRQIIERLSNVNKKIQELADKIKGLKAELDNLKGVVTGNTSDIGNKDKEIQALKAQIVTLDQEKTKAEGDLAQLRDTFQKEKEQLERGAADAEAQLRNVSDQVNALTAERDALKAELAGRGDPADHAKAIEDLTNQHAAQTQAQQAQHQQELDQQKQDLQKQIQDKDNEIAQAIAESHRLAAELATANQQILDLGIQMQELTGRTQQQIADLTTERDNLAAQIAGLQQQIQVLTDENADLIQRIMAATRAISEATDSLRQISDNDPTQFNQEEVERSFAEIEASIQAISNSLSGSPAPPQIPVQKPSISGRKAGMDPNTNITVKDNKNADITFTLKQLMEELRVKAGRVAGIDKYETALTAIRAATTPQEVVDILRTNNIAFKNGAMMGGRKTRRRGRKTRRGRRTRKNGQRGGFIYKSHTKRRSLTQSVSKDVARGRKSKKH
jgi:predicted  nucleic acid-binding Zn-ribbon protein